MYCRLQTIFNLSCNTSLLRTRQQSGKRLVSFPYLLVGPLILLITFCVIARFSIKTRQQFHTVYPCFNSNLQEKWIICKSRSLADLLLYKLHQIKYYRSGHMHLFFSGTILQTAFVKQSLTTAQSHCFTTSYPPHACNSS